MLKKVLWWAVMYFWAIMIPVSIFYIKEYNAEKEKLQEQLTVCEQDLTKIQEEIKLHEEEHKEEEPKLKSLGKFKITAYCSCSKCCGKSDGITASGAKATAGRTIAAPSTFKFGTKLIINGHEYTVEDRGGAIKGNRIDIYFDSHQEALNFGVKYIEVFIEEK
jgi:3D (Asp-Asp-Asp) domain-containing protein